MLYPLSAGWCSLYLPLAPDCHLVPPSPAPCPPPNILWTILSLSPIPLGDAYSLCPYSLLPLSGCRLATVPPTPWVLRATRKPLNDSISYFLGVHAIGVQLDPSIPYSLGAAWPSVFCCSTPLSRILWVLLSPRISLLARFLRRWRSALCPATGGKGDSAP